MSPRLRRKPSQSEAAKLCQDLSHLVDGREDKERLWRQLPTETQEFFRSLAQAEKHKVCMYWWVGFTNGMDAVSVIACIYGSKNDNYSLQEFF